MNETVTLTINGNVCTVPPGTTVAAAMILAGLNEFRRSVQNSPRGPLCGMGICFECRATINGQPQRKTCQILATNGMEVVVDGITHGV